MARLNVNGKVLQHQAEADTPLLWVLREQLGMTGTKYGCGVAQCGSCTVHIDGAAVRSCAMPVAAVQERQKVVTIEGLSVNITNICRCGTFNRVRAAIKEAAGVTKTAGLDIIHVTRSVA